MVPGGALGPGLGGRDARGAASLLRGRRGTILHRIISCCSGRFSLTWQETIGAVSFILLCCSRCQQLQAALRISTKELFYFVLSS